MTRGEAPERWQVDAGEAPVARLTVPADLRRERVFEVSVTMSVRVAPDAVGAWHRLTVLADGVRQWQRRVDTSTLGGADGLEYRFERRLPPGRPLALQAQAECAGARRERLVLSAEQVPG